MWLLTDLSSKETIRSPPVSLSYPKQVCIYRRIPASRFGCGEHPQRHSRFHSRGRGSVILEREDQWTIPAKYFGNVACVCAACAGITYFPCLLKFLDVFWKTLSSVSTKKNWWALSRFGSVNSLWACFFFVCNKISQSPPRRCICLCSLVFPLILKVLRRFSQNLFVSFYKNTSGSLWRIGFVDTWAHFLRMR